MKASVVTLHRVFNYGSVLQAYATQLLIEQNNIDCEIVDYITEQRTIKRIKNDYEVNGIKSLIYKYLRCVSIDIKNYEFSKFIKKHIHLSNKKYISVKDLRENPPVADIYVAGSDQIWNSQYNDGIDGGFFLDFGSKNTKRIAISSSFGKAKLDENEIEETKNLLRKFTSISVREQSAKKIIEQMGFDSPKVLLDPTLLIPKEKWLEISSKRLVKKPYLILMLLYAEDNNATEYARQIADEKGLQLVKISWDLFKDKRVDKLFTHRKPEDFLSLFYNAEYVVTNSFHGLAFSLNLNKQFMVIQRNEFNSRIDSLLDTFGLNERLVSDNLDFNIVNKQIDYNIVNEKMGEIRKDNYEYLQKVLSE